MELGLRLELFASDVHRPIAFYRDVLGFILARRQPDYASLRAGGVTLGLGPVAKLPQAGGYFTRGRLAGDRGAGYPVAEEPQPRPWGLTVFRRADPDGYHLRVTPRG